MKQRHKGNSRKKAKIVVPPPSSAPDPSPHSKRSPPPPLPPPPARLFPNYPSPSSTSSTPLPPPSMPRKSFLRRILPLVLVGSAAFAYRATSKKIVTENDGKTGLEFSSLPPQSTETTGS
ncbi:unnamed protein product [Musa hybrid cultivar]